MKNEESWAPSKIDWGPDSRWRVRKEGVSPGSYLAATVQFDALVPLIRRYLKGRIADIGAGDVPFYPGYRNQAESIACIDWAGSSHAVEKYSDILCDLNKEISLPNQSIDAALLSSVLEHIAEPRVLLRELYRCLAPGGAVVIEVPFFYWLHEEPNDYYRYTRHALTRLAEEAGFEIEHLAAYGNAFIVMGDIAAKTAVFLTSRLHWRLQPAVKWATRGFQHLTYLVFKRLDGSIYQHYFPLGYVMVLKRPSAN